MKTKLISSILGLVLVLTGAGCGRIEPPVPVPAIPPCELMPGQSTALAATGGKGATVLEWHASAGQLTPDKGPAVTYTAPKDYSGPVVITITAKKGNAQEQGTMTCTILAAPTSTPSPTPEPTDTLPPTAILSPTPPPTQWVCSSYRSEKLQDANIPGTVTIDTPSQGTTDLPSGKSIQVGGTYSGIPKGKYLWVFIYSAQAGLHGRYYPQTKDAVKGWQPDPTTGQDGKWSLNVGFGAPSLCYEVIVLVADATVSQSIADQLKSWAAAKDYPGYELHEDDSLDAVGLPASLVEKASIEVKTK